jgi:hypothetical protein
MRLDFLCRSNPISAPNAYLQNCLQASIYNREVALLRLQRKSAENAIQVLMLFENRQDAILGTPIAPKHTVHGNHRQLVSWVHNAQLASQYA